MNIIKDIEDDPLYSKFDLTQQGYLALYFGVLTKMIHNYILMFLKMISLINKKEEKALYYFLKAINLNNSDSSLISDF